MLRYFAIKYEKYGKKVSIIEQTRNCSYLYGMPTDETVFDAIPNSIKYLYLHHTYNNDYNLGNFAEFKDIEELRLGHDLYSNTDLDLDADIEFLEDLDKLKTLTISSTRLKYDLSRISLPDIEKLILEGDGVICDISDIIENKNLKHLEIRRCENISGD